MNTPTFTAYDSGYYDELNTYSLTNKETLYSELQSYFSKYLLDKKCEVVSLKYGQYIENNSYSLSNLLMPTLKVYKQLEHNLSAAFEKSTIHKFLADFAASNIEQLISADVLLNPNVMAEEDFTNLQARHIHRCVIGTLLIEKVLFHLERNHGFTFDLERSYITHYLLEVNKIINKYHPNATNSHHLYYSI